MIWIKSYQRDTEKGQESFLLQREVDLVNLKSRQEVPHNMAKIYKENVTISVLFSVEGEQWFFSDFVHVPYLSLALTSAIFFFFNNWHPQTSQLAFFYLHWPTRRNLQSLFNPSLILQRGQKWKTSETDEALKIKKKKEKNPAVKRVALHRPAFVPPPRPRKMG